jgi:hypothetical protein
MVRDIDPYRQRTTHMGDTFNLTAALNAQTYATGALMTLTVSGSVTGVTSATDTISILITASDGTTTTLSAGPVTVTKAAPLTFKITSVTDGGGRVWAIGSAGNTATATA